MRQYELFELSYTAPAPVENQVAVELTAVFSINGVKTSVKGFYAGNDTYKVRYLPLAAGTCRYQVTGLVSDGGELTCAPAAPGKHGPVRAQGTHFRYDDGSWYYPFGTTVYALAHQEPELIRETLQTLAGSPFNKLRTCVFPKHYDYNTNEPSFLPFCRRPDGSWDTARPCFPFWDHLEEQLAALEALDIQTDLILFHPYDHWGLADLPKEDAMVYLDYVVRRFSAFPHLWWSLANEYELLDGYTLGDWHDFSAFLHRNDPVGHLLSNHNIFQGWDFEDPATTHICIQGAADLEVSGRIRRYQKPMMLDECCYEGNIPWSWGHISGAEMTHRFWVTCMQGGYCTHGETFLNETETLWWSKGGRLTGESPARIGFLRELLESLPGPLEFAGKQVDEALVAETRAQFAEMGKTDRVRRLLSRADSAVLTSFLRSSQPLMGRCGEEAYVRYFGRSCPSVEWLELPECGKYDIELLDVWEMTRAPLCAGVCGKVELHLPGKEWMAVVARKVG